MSEFLNLVWERLPQLRVAILDHLLILTLLPISIATLLAVPAGILIAPRPLLRSFVLGLSGAIQTVPSLALLAFMLPVFGIGTFPAVVALVAYSLLPILQATITAIQELPRNLMNTAAAIGFSRRQQILWVELPLAIPVVISGLRTATVICVGVATLSTFIGAGGLGDFINRGLALMQPSLLLIGAGASAILALSLDFVIETVGILLQVGPKRKRFGWRLGVVCLLLVGFAAVVLSPKSRSGTEASGSDSARSIRIGSKGFTEQLILAELLAQRIELQTAYTVERQFGLGGSVICHQALASGEIDLYVEYTGTAHVVLFGEEYRPGTPPQTILESVQARYAQDLDCMAFSPLGFQNSYALAVRRDDAEEKGWKNISDIVPIGASLRAGLTAEFMEREDGLLGLQAIYGLRFGATVDLRTELMYAAIGNREVDAVSAFSTDGRIQTFDLKILKDDRLVLPPYHAIPVVRKATLLQFSELGALIADLTGRIDDQAMIRLNYQVDMNKQSPETAVQEFIEATWKEN